MKVQLFPAIRIRMHTSAMTDDSLSHGGGEPPPISAPMATRPPPESPNRFSILQIGAIRSIVHPPSTTTRFPSSTVSDLPLTRYTPLESSFPYGFVFSLLPHHQGFKSELPSLPFHFRVNNLLSTINDCGAGENKHAQWAGTCDVRTPTPLIRTKNGLVEGDVQNSSSCRDLSMVVNET